MAITIPRQPMKELIAARIGKSDSFIAKLMRDGIYIEPGASSVTHLNKPTPIAVTKGSTSVEADAGTSTAKTPTVAQYTVPNEFLDYEVANLSDRAIEHIANASADAIMLQGLTALIDAMSDAPLTNWNELSDSGATFNNFATPNNTTADMRANLAVLGSSIKDVRQYGKVDWILAHPEAFGNLWGYNQLVQAGVTANGNDLFINGLPVYTSEEAGTASKWGADAKPCVIVGSNQALGLNIGPIRLSDGLTPRGHNNILSYDVTVTYTYVIGDEAKGLSAVYNYDYTP